MPRCENRQFVEDVEGGMPCCGGQQMGYRPMGALSCGPTTVSSSPPSARCPPSCDFKDRLEARIKKHYADIKKGCQSMDVHATGRVLRSQMLQVLRTFCFPLTTAQFNQVVKLHQVDPRGKVYYCKFLTDMAGTSPDVAPDPEMAEIPRCVTIEELEMMIQNKINKDLRNVVRSFFLYDVANDGFIQKRELRKVLETYCFKFSDHQFDEFYGRYDRERTGVVCYADFLVKIGVNVDRCRRYIPKDTLATAMCWSDKTVENCVEKLQFTKSRFQALKNYEDDPCIKGVTMNGVITMFLKKMKNKGMDDIITNACHIFDKRNDGHIYLKDFHSVLNRFVMPMGLGLYRNIMCTLVPEKQSFDKFCWKMFVKRYCHDEPYSCPMYCHADRAQLARGHAVMDKLRLFVPNPKDRIAAAITRINEDAVRVISRTEFRRVVDRDNFRLTTEEFKDFFFLLDPHHCNFFPVADFFAIYEPPAVKPLNVIPPGTFKAKLNSTKVPHYRDPEKGKLMEPDDVKPVVYSWGCNRRNKRGEDGDGNVGKTVCNTLLPFVNCSTGYPHLHEDDLKKRIRRNLNQNYDLIERSLLAADYQESGKVHLMQLRTIFHCYIFPLTNEQWEEVMWDFTTVKNEISYKLFLNLYRRDPNEVSDVWLKRVHKSLAGRPARVTNLTAKEVDNYLRETVRAKRNALLRDLMAMDPSTLGLVTKSDFRRLLNKHAFRMNERQFEKVWFAVPKNETNTLLRYVDFMRDFSVVDQESCVPVPCDNDCVEREPYVLPNYPLFKELV